MTETPQTPPETDEKFIIQGELEAEALAEQNEDFNKEAAKRAGKFVDIGEKQPLTGKQKAKVVGATVAAAAGAVVAANAIGTGLDNFLDGKDTANEAHQTTLEQSEQTGQEKMDVYGLTPPETDETLPQPEPQTASTQPDSIPSLPTPKTH